jgi:hypothetical protein
VSKSLAVSEPTDLLFALVGGIYASLVVVPCVLFATNGLLSDAGASYAVAVAGFGTITLVGTVLLRRSGGLAVSLGGSRYRLVPALAPAAALGGCYLTATAFGRPPSGGAVLFGTVSALGALAGGGVLAVMADTRYTRAVTERVKIRATWRAPWPEEHRRLAKLAGAFVFVGAAAGFAAGAFFDQPLLRYGGQFVMPLGIVAATWGQPRTYRATSVGLETETPVRRHLSPWARFDGYMITDRAVVVHPSAPWRLPLYLDRESLADTEAVTDALGVHLPRLPT